MILRFEGTFAPEVNVLREERQPGRIAFSPRTMSASHFLCRQSSGATSSLANNATAYPSHLLRLAGEHLSKAVFLMFCLIVMAVSVHDAMLVILNSDLILEVERNPVGRWLIELQRGDIWLFVLTKFLGTAVVCSILVMMYEFRVRQGLLAAAGVASFQLVLLCYLTFGRG